MLNINFLNSRKINYTLILHLIAKFEQYFGIEKSPVRRQQY